jgi:hypothetical protein
LAGRRFHVEKIFPQSSAQYRHIEKEDAVGWCSQSSLASPRNALMRSWVLEIVEHCESGCAGRLIT